MITTFPQRLEEIIKFMLDLRNAKNLDIGRKMWDSTPVLLFLFLNKEE